jgi:arylformamidase
LARITPHEHLRQKDISKNDFILLKTRNSFLDILEGAFVYLDQTGAQYLKDKGIKGVGRSGLKIPEL